MATIVNITGTVNQSVVKATIMAPPGSAGTALPYTSESASAIIANTSQTAGFEYKINSGPWKYVGRGVGPQEAINFQSDSIYFRQTSGDTSLTTVEISIDTTPVISVFNAKTPNIAAQEKRRFVLLGDSRTQFGQPYRAPDIFDGRTWYITGGNFAGLGASAWIPYVIMEGTATINTQGILSSDATGLLSWAYNGDTPGPKVDVSQGGWFFLQTGTLGVGLLVAVLGASAKVLNGGATVTNSGFPLVWDYDLRGHVPWIAGALGDTFSDYQAWGIPGATTQDIIKFMPQVFSKQPTAEAVFIEAAVNNIPNTGSTVTQANNTIADMKTIINYISGRANNTYVSDIWPAPVKDTAAQKYIDRINSAIRAHCRTLRNVWWVPSSNRLANYTPGASGVATGKTGTYQDNLHLLAYGAYQATINPLNIIKQHYPPSGSNLAAIDPWDATLQAGALNPNPTMLGTAGTGSGSNGVTGTVPTNWSITRTGTTQTCAGAIVAANDGGNPWYTMTVAAATLNDFHQLQSSINPFPSGIALGDYYRIVVEMQIGAMSAGGIGTIYIACTGNTNLNNAVVVQLISQAWPVDTFTTENPVLTLASEPQKLLDITTPYTLRMRVGAVVGGTGTIGIRNYRIEKVPGPIYP